jgi:hypothetical protein
MMPFIPMAIAMNSMPTEAYHCTKDKGKSKGRAKGRGVCIVVYTAFAKFLASITLLLFFSERGILARVLEN